MKKSNLGAALLAVVLTLSLSAAALADTIRLRDGSVVRGQIIAYKDQQFTVLIGAGARGRRSRMTIYSEDIESIEFDATDTTAAGAGNDAANDDRAAAGNSGGTSTVPAPRNSPPVNTRPQPDTTTIDRTDNTTGAVVLPLPARSSFAPSLLWPLPVSVAPAVASNSMDSMSSE